MITVYVWNPHGGQVGHASAQIGVAGGPDSYISWWPSNPSQWMKSHPGAAYTLADDVSAEGGPAHVTMMVCGLDSTAAARWWKSLKTRRASYSAARYNCAWAVITALKAAGADARIGWTGVLAKYNLSLGGAFPLLCATAAVTSVAANSTKGVVGTVDRCTSIWTPADVVRYVGAIR